MRLRIRIGLILLLAMLQGISPMLHAHVGHDQAASAAFHFHIAAPGSDASAQHYDEDTRRDAGTVIGVADQMRQDAALAIDHGEVGATRMRVKSEHHRTPAPSVNPRPISIARPFALPLALAPPAIVR